ncbi:hypothetical protein OIDMADRAFT_185267, partial [Oidiodendron maius Zn]
MSNPKDYAVGWICAISTEYVAAQEILDVEHERPEYVSPNDNNDYTLGEIGKHNIVIAVLPDGEYGTASAASVATNMLRSFPNVRIGLMVGIGGGAPSKKHDIRLGDIVVSSPRDREGGVFQYDFGKTIQGQKFQETRFLNQPPTLLRTAVSGLKTQYERKGHLLEKTINGILEKNLRLQKKYKRPEPSTDRLYQSTVTHTLNDDSNCATVCGDDPSHLVSRPERTENEDNPAIHYGLIASANQLMKDALIRDKLAAEKAVLCFEMEAAGLMNNFPCLVIRGICDYSDSHKNKAWQGYAAMAAAVYAKDLLSRIPPNMVEAAKRIVDAISNRVENRVHGTCEWFLNHEHFRSWLKQDSGPLLVSADPGCGKSVLAKYLIDDGLPRSATICYFFFKDQDQNTVRQALCALLHQLFSKKPPLIEHAMKQFSKDGQGLINSTNSLWTILENAVQDPEAGSVIIVLDALDECLESEFVGLIRHMEDQFRGNKSNRGRLKYLLTSRPYEQTMSEFHGLLDAFPYIRIPGEEDLESISLEVDLLVSITHRTYLWVYLVFDYLNAENFKKTSRGVDSAMKVMPKTIYEAYEQILNKSKDHPTVRKALSIILAASRPLTLLEMNVAVSIDDTSKSIHDVDLEEEMDFKTRLRSWCGLFVSIHHGKIYFLHQTAREFLLAELRSPTTVPAGLSWYQSITIDGAHAVLAEACMRYLDFFNSDTNLVQDASREASYDVEDSAFMDYSAINWGLHFREAHIGNDATIFPFALRVCDPDSIICSRWFAIYWRYRYGGAPSNFTIIMISSCFGHEAIVKLLLESGRVDPDSKNEFGRTPLSFAAGEGHEAVVKLLLESDRVDPDLKDEDGRTPLMNAAISGHEAVAKLLLESGRVDPDSK